MGRTGYSPDAVVGELHEIVDKIQILFAISFDGTHLSLVAGGQSVGSWGNPGGALGVNAIIDDPGIVLRIDEESATLKGTKRVL